MNRSGLLSLIATAAFGSMILGFSPASIAATATNLVTICTSATTTIQASKCTAWQYNVYSPTAYIESYPQVSPGPNGYTDPNYEYRLGSSLTPTNGVKVCPTALTPGVSFNSPYADPCPNNKLVAASTVLPPNTYAVTTNADGIVVYQVNTAGVSVVPGGPFVPSPPPFNAECNCVVPAPVLTAVDPTGQYLWAIYLPGTGSTIWSFNMVNGVPHQVATSGGPFGPCSACDPGIHQFIVTAQHIYLDYGSLPASAFIATTKNGVITSSFSVAFDYSGLSTTASLGPISFAVDPQEQFLYWYASSTGTTTPDTVVIYSLNFASLSATPIQAMPSQGTFTLGAK